METVLVTGGAGYVGSHACVELLEKGFRIVVMDNLSNSSEEAIQRIGEITGKPVPFYRGDLLDRKMLEKIFSSETIGVVMHFAGLKAVGESVSKPLEYYRNNITGTLTLCSVMEQYGVRDIIFSSSATVYGDPASVPIQEDFPVSATNPYGRTKLMIEEILKDINTADSTWNIILLRYFNPVGAHPSGLIGEEPQGIPNNLMPYMAQVAIGRLENLSVFGNDYPTKDGTGVRDYIHVVDLVRGHVSALRKIQEKPGVAVYNLGRGEGYSVLEMIQAFEKASGKEIPYTTTERRPGDIAECYADPSKAEKEMGWKAEKGLEEMCRDTWHWQSQNPEGYK